jgi:hypothetical protein
MKTHDAALSPVFNQTNMELLMANLTPYLPIRVPNFIDLQDTIVAIKDEKELMYFRQAYDKMVETVIGFQSNLPTKTNLDQRRAMKEKQLQTCGGAKEGDGDKKAQNKAKNNNSNASNYPTNSDYNTTASSSTNTNANASSVGAKELPVPPNSVSPGTSSLSNSGDKPFRAKMTFNLSAAVERHNREDNVLPRGGLTEFQTAKVGGGDGAILSQIYDANDRKLSRDKKSTGWYESFSRSQANTFGNKVQHSARLGADICPLELPNLSAHDLLPELEVRDLEDFILLMVAYEKYLFAINDLSKSWGLTVRRLFEFFDQNKIFSKDVAYFYQVDYFSNLFFLSSFSFFSFFFFFAFIAN